MRAPVKECWGRDGGEGGGEGGGQLCAIFLARVVAFFVAWRDFAVSGSTRNITKLKFVFCCENFKVHHLPSSH